MISNHITIVSIQKLNKVNNNDDDNNNNDNNNKGLVL